MKIFIKIFEHIKRYLNKLFIMKEKKLLSEKNEIIEDIIEESFDITELQKEKQDFFQMYQKFKSDSIEFENLTINDLIKIMIISQEESEFINKNNKENSDNKNQIKALNTTAKLF